MIQITSNAAKWVKQGQDTASVFRRNDVQNMLKRDLAKVVRQMNKRQILGQGIGKSGRFAPLKPATLKKKKGSRILVDTGSLFRKATRGGTIKSGYIEAFSVFSFNFNINHVAARFHQLGTTFMPRRPIIDPTDRQQRELINEFWKGISRSWRRIGWADKLTRGRLTGFDRIEIDGQ